VLEGERVGAWREDHQGFKVAGGDGPVLDGEDGVIGGGVGGYCEIVFIGTGGGALADEEKSALLNRVSVIG
jgi:hypothetical protein